MSLPIVAFDGVQGAALPREALVALPFAPLAGVPAADLFDGVERARHAAELVVAAVRRAEGRVAVLTALRELGPFDAHGDPIDPPVWLWRAGPDWEPRPERPL